MPGRTVQGSITVLGQQIHITNPDKMLWPAVGITKSMYLQKLSALAPYLLKYCRNRLLTTIRYPHGADGMFFYQKNAPEPVPDFVNTVIESGIKYVVMDGLPELLWLGNLAAMEFHPSLHYVGSDLPCEWMIDLDPSMEEEPRIMEAASIVGDVLAGLGIQSIPKTSGATGVQIIVPIQEGVTFDDLRRMGLFVGQYVVEKAPHLFTLERMKKHRGDKIYFDYLQHYGGKTLAAPYTPRSKPLATVSTPLTWDEVRSGVTPADFHLLNIEQRLAITGDLIGLLPPQPIEPVVKYLDTLD